MVRDSLTVLRVIIREANMYKEPTKEELSNIWEELKLHLGEAVFTISDEELGEWIMSICEDEFYKVTVRVERDNGTIDTF